MKRLPTTTAILVITVVLTACTRSSPASNPSGQAASQATPAAPAAPKRVAIAIFREVDFLPNNPTPGSPDVRHLVNPGLTVLDDRGGRQPLLVESVPTLENGQWRVLPDGRTETTWTLRSGARWHDGEPLTVEDLLFTVQIGQDREVGAFGHAGYQSLDELVETGDRTVTARWKRPFIDADQMFTIAFAYPLPKHVLRPVYQQDKATFTQIPFWTQSFVGSGPYRVHEYSPGTRILLEAFPDYLPGRPKIDELELSYMPDPNTVLANVLAGLVDMTLGIGLPIDSALEMRDRWREGRFTFEFSDRRWFVLDPQFVDPNPAVIGDLRFRRALLHAIDRQEMADTLQGGMSPVAHTFVSPNQPELRGLEERVLKYEYDPRKATQMMEELGYRRGSDGIFLAPNGQRLEVEILASNPATVKPMLSVADYWQRVGVAAVTSEMPAQRATDWPWRAVFPGFTLFTGTHDLDGLPALYSNRAMLPENNFTIAGIQNWPRYRSPELDGLLDRYFSTLPRGERIELLTQINVHIAENLNLMGLYYFPTPYAIANRLENIPLNRASKASIAWNVQQWDARRS
jgi:peptide/nickel transport system substrate-binding protein